LESFAALRRDIEAFGADFLTGACEQLRDAAQARCDAERKNPTQRLADIEAALKAQRDRNGSA
jgi:hypothetical protein